MNATTANEDQNVGPETVHRLSGRRRPSDWSEAGEYRLRSTVEVVVDPDYTAVWTIRRHG